MFTEEQKQQLARYAKYTDSFVTGLVYEFSSEYHRLTLKGEVQLPPIDTYINEKMEEAGSQLAEFVINSKHSLREIGHHTHKMDYDYNSRGERINCVGRIEV